MDDDALTGLPTPPPPECGPLPPPPPPRPVDPLATPVGWGWQELCERDEPPPQPLAAPPPRRVRWRVVAAAVAAVAALGVWASLAADAPRDVVATDPPAATGVVEGH